MQLQVFHRDTLVGVKRPREEAGYPSAHRAWELFTGMTNEAELAAEERSAKACIGTGRFEEGLR